MGDSTNDTDAGSGVSAPTARPKINPQIIKAQRAYVSTANLASAGRSAAARTAPLAPPVTAPAERGDIPEIDDPKILHMAVNPLSEVQRQIEQVQRNAYGIYYGLVILPLRRLATFILWPINKMVEVVNRVMAAIVRVFNRILAVMFRISGYFRGGQVPDMSELEEPVHPDDRAPEAARETAPPPPPPKVTWSEMLELNIIFTDNQNTPLYTLKQTRGTGRLGNLEEKMIAENALYAIQECAVFTEEFPPPTAGPYFGRPIKGVMEDVVPEDVQGFLRFVKAFPGKYVGKSWKISETFATWLLNNSPGP